MTWLAGWLGESRCYRRSVLKLLTDPVRVCAWHTTTKQTQGMVVEDEAAMRQLEMQQMLDYQAAAGGMGV